MIDVLEPMKKVLPSEGYNEIVETLGVKLLWNTNYSPLPFLGVI